MNLRGHSTLRGFHPNQQSKEFQEASGPRREPFEYLRQPSKKQMNTCCLFSRYHWVWGGCFPPLPLIAVEQLELCYWDSECEKLGFCRLFAEEHLPELMH